MRISFVTHSVYCFGDAVSLFGCVAVPRAAWGLVRRHIGARLLDAGRAARGRHRLAHELATGQGRAAARGRGILREAALDLLGGRGVHQAVRTRRVGGAPAQSAVCADHGARRRVAGAAQPRARSRDSPPPPRSAPSCSSYQVAIWLATDAPLLAAVSVALARRVPRLLCRTVARATARLYVDARRPRRGVLEQERGGLDGAGAALWSRCRIWERRWREIVALGTLCWACCSRRPSFSPGCGSSTRAPDGPEHLKVFFWNNLVGRFAHVDAPADSAVRRRPSQHPRASTASSCRCICGRGRCSSRPPRGARGGARAARRRASCAPVRFALASASAAARRAVGGGDRPQYLPGAGAAGIRAAARLVGARTARGARSLGRARRCAAPPCCCCSRRCWYSARRWASSASMPGSA